MKRQQKQSTAVLCLGILLLMAVSGCESFLAAKMKLQKPRFYIKVKGMGSLAAGGDFDHFVELNDIYFNGLNDNSPEHDIKVTTPPPYFLGFGGEIGLETDRFAIGIAAAYIEKKFALDYHHVDESTTIENDYVETYKFSAIPIFLLINYKIIDTSSFAAGLTVGQGVYLASYSDHRAQTFKNFDITFVNSYVKSHKARPGFHLGTTLELKITQNLGLVAEAAYRWVKFEEMKARDYYEDNNGVNENEGDFYYWSNRRTGEVQFGIGVNSRPNWDSTLAVLNLDGFSFSVGIKITFGSIKKEKPVKIAPVE